MTDARRPLAIAAIAVASGAALGVASHLSDSLPHPANLVGTLGGPWLAVAFAVGAAARSRGSALWAGALSMAAAVGAYYVAREVTSPGSSGFFTGPGQAPPYLAIGLLAGAAMAALGAAWRRDAGRWRWVGPGLLAGALGAEVLVLTVRAWTGSELVFAGLQGAAAVLVAMLLPGGRRNGLAALALGAVSAAAVGGLILAADLPLRLFG